mgnify:CR=1 FL=1
MWMYGVNNFGDHPHIHGEHQKSKPLNMPNVGSPPYTWGALVLRIAKLIKFRITPIYMGSTVVVNPIMVDIRDHPHIHGEHTDTINSFPTLSGSPPYTWGAQRLGGSLKCGDGITPIYMGSTIW